MSTLAAASHAPRAVLPHEAALPLNWLASALFALFVAFMPWEAIRGDAFADLANYARRMEQISDYGTGYFEWTDSLVGWLSFEYFWFRLLALAAAAEIEPAAFMRAVTLVAAFLTHRFLAARVGPLVAFVVLANPITIDLLSSQTRSAFAFALFLTAADWLVARRHLHWRYAAFAALPFIHTAAIAFVAFYTYAIALAAQRWLAPALKAALTLLLAGAFVAAVVVVLPGLAEAAGDRRGALAYETKTLTYLLFWFLAAGALAVSYDRTATARWEYVFALLVCTAAPLIEALGRPGFRFVALSLPVIWIGLGFTRGWVRWASMAASVAYGVLLYGYWIG